MLRSLLFVFTVIIILVSCKKQSNEEDQLGYSSVEFRNASLLSKYNSISSQNDGEKKLKSLLKIVDEAIQAGNDSISYLANSSAMKLSTKLMDSMGLAESYWNLAILTDRKNLIDSSFFYYKKANIIYTEIGNKYYSAKMEYNMSHILFTTKNYAGSEVMVVKALNKFLDLNRYLNVYKCFNRLLLISKELGRYDEALNNYEMARDYLNLADDKSIESIGLMNNLSLVYQKQGRYDEAIEVLDEALENEDLENLNRNLYVKIVDNRAYNRFLNGDTTAVRDDFERAADIREAMDNEAGMVISHLHLAKYDLKYGDTLDALTHGRNAYELSKKNGFNRDVLESLKMLSKTDPNQAADYMEEYAALNDKLIEEERNVRDKFARIQFETERYVEQNRDLEKKNASIILLSTVLISAGLFFFVIFRQRSKNKTLQLENEQQEANEQIYDLMLKQQNRMEEGRVQERVRISEELHDGVLARLFGIRMGMGFLKIGGDEESESKYKAYLKELQGAEQEIRTLSRALKNDELSAKKDFPLLLRELLVDQARIGGFNYKFVQNTDIAWDRIQDRVKINLYRIVQEALHNAIRYAGCSSVEVSIRRSENNLELTISDDGNGFKLKKKQKGIGIRNMRSRSKQIGARFTIRSEPNQGTAIKISIQTKHIYNDRDIQGIDR